MAIVTLRSTWCLTTSFTCLSKPLGLQLPSEFVIPSKEISGIVYNLKPLPVNKKYPEGDNLPSWWQIFSERKLSMPFAFCLKADLYQMPDFPKYRGHKLRESKNC